MSCDRTLERTAKNRPTRVAMLALGVDLANHTNNVMWRVSSDALSGPSQKASFNGHARLATAKGD